MPTKEEHAADVRRKYHDNRRIVLSHYSPDMTCQRCSFTDIRALTVDHIEGGGKQHVKKIGGNSGAFYRWIIKNCFPPGFQVLCRNCQSIKADENNEYKAPWRMK